MAKGQLPAFNVRAKTGRKDDQDRDIFITVGGAWPFKNGAGYSVKINSLPVPFDGFLILSEPVQED
jgi:hypothetical protein